MVGGEEGLGGGGGGEFEVDGGWGGRWFRGEGGAEFGGAEEDGAGVGGVVDRDGLGESDDGQESEQEETREVRGEAHGVWGLTRGERGGFGKGVGKRKRTRKRKKNENEGGRGGGFLGAKKGGLENPPYWVRRVELFV